MCPWHARCATLIPAPIAAMVRRFGLEPKPARRRELVTITEVGDRLGMPGSPAYDAARHDMFPVVRNGSRMEAELRPRRPFKREVSDDERAPGVVEGPSPLAIAGLMLRRLLISAAQSPY